MAATVLLTLTLTAFVMTLTTVWERMTSVEYVTDLALSYECGCADIPEDCDCDETNQLDALVNVAATVKRTLTQTESVIQKSKDVQIQKTLTTIQVLHLTMGLV